MSIKRNFFYSSILTTANYIFPFLTYPYVSRVLGVTNIGICNFVDSIINYFILFSMMGIGTVGVREIARCGNKQERDKVFSSLFTLNTISTTIMVAVLVLTTYTVPKLYEHKELMLIGALKLIANYMLVEWLYKGIEDFKFITYRTIAVKVIYVAAVFIFIREQNDYLTYYLLLALMIAVNAAVNIFYARHFVTFRLKASNVRPFVKPFLVLGVYMLLTSMYSSFNVAYLGFAADETEVGYYTTATKLYSILLALFTAFTTVMMPRMSRLIGENDTGQFKQMLNKSVDALFIYSVPLVLLSTIMAPQIIAVIVGNGYEGAILPMRIVMPLMLVIGYEQILVIQTLMPLKKDRAILINSIIGASIGLLMNILLVVHFKSIGTSIVWVCSEISVLCSAQYFVTKYIGIKIPFLRFFKEFLYNLPLVALLCCLYLLNIGNAFILLALAYFITATYSFILQVCILKNEIAVNLIHKAIGKNTTLKKFLTIKFKHRHV